eukprot:scaffold125057_cov75-Phaeocystis_antarctica.AAC.1
MSPEKTRVVHLCMELGERDEWCDNIRRLKRLYYREAKALKRTMKGKNTAVVEPRSGILARGVRERQAPLVITPETVQAGPVPGAAGISVCDRHVD